MTTKDLNLLLKREQAEDGHFSHTSWPDGDGPKSGQKQSSVFFTSLILNELCHFPEQAEMEEIKRKAKDFLLSQKSPNWTFNYWHRNSPKLGTLPDDWDDTACSVAALYRYDPSILDGSAKASITKALIACETQPGGPYKTWFTSSDESMWKDTDVAVNANIAWLLKLQGISLPPLNHFIEHAIATGALTSPYYPSIDIVAYFVSRAIPSTQSQQLADFIKTQPAPRHPLYAALRALALLNCGADKRSISWLIKYIQKSAVQTSTTPFCFDPATNSSQFVAGNESLNAIFIERALKEYYEQPGPKLLEKENTNDIHTRVLGRVDQIINSLPETLTAPVPALLERLHQGDKTNQITLLPFWTAEAFGLSQNEWQKSVSELGTISMLGWMAYTLYDDLMDSSGYGPALPLANRLSQEFTLCFTNVVKSDADCLNLYRGLMDEMESANVWEILHCHLPRTKLLQIPSELPDFNSLEQLAHKSIGHALGPLTLAMMSNQVKQVPNLKKFFTHYLIAKQLHDDAHDWLEDLQNFQLTSVNTLLLKKCGYDGKELSLEQVKSELQRKFWHSVIDEVLELISGHLLTAEQILAQAGLAKPEILEKQLIHPLRQATQNTKIKTAEASQFLQAYQASQA